MGTATDEDGLADSYGLSDTESPEQSGVHPVQRLKSGDPIGDKYIVRGTLGVGGFAVVYDAEHSLLEKYVAIKVMHLDADTPPELVDRFRQEARFSAVVRHPNVLDVYDTGTLEDGSPFLVMERIEGETLYRRMTRQGLSIPTLVEVARQLLTALNVLSERGIVHRDIKPENVMLHSPSRSLTVVKLLDFGISKSVAHTDPHSTSAMIGTPHYMSPEQIRGESVDPRADLYALGVVLYEALTGRVPFDGASLNALVLAVLNADLTPVRALREDCPVELERIVHKAMSRNRDERYAQPSEMFEDLERLATSLQMPQGQAVWLDPPWQSLTEVAGRADAEAEAAASAHLQTRTSEHGDADPPVMSMARRAIERLKGHKRDSVRNEIADSDALLTAKKPRRMSHNARLCAFSLLVLVGILEPKATSPASSFMGAGMQASDMLGPGRANAMPQGAALVPQVSTIVQAGSEPQKSLAAQNERAAPAAKELLKSRNREARKTNKLARGPKAQRPQSESAITREAFSAYLRGDLEHAYSLYRRAVHEFPASTEGWRGLGLVSTRLGKFDEARRALGRYLTLAPEALDAAAIAEHRQKLP